MVKLRIRIGVLTKIIVFLTVLLVPLAAVTWYVSVRTLRAQMTEEFTSKGTAIANSLASSGVGALVAVAAGAVFARRITRPLGEIVRVAEQVGRGDLTHTVRVRSRDEIGQLARTVNDTVTRLRSQVLTEAERDEERKRREELQKNISVFLETVTQIAQGDLRKRG